MQRNNRETSFLLLYSCYLSEASQGLFLSNLFWICMLLEERVAFHICTLCVCKPCLTLFSLQAVTLAAAFNDVGSWALVGWQATFYQRVYELGPDVYAPALAGILPIGGIIGGVGGEADG